MFQYAVRRILLTIPVLFAVLLITFTLGFYGPGDPITIMFGEERPVDPEAVARLRHLYGLDRPYWVQFADYVTDLMQGDFGTSIRTRRPVLESMMFALPVSAKLGLGAVVLLIFIGVPLGVLAAVRQNTWIDYWIVAFSIAVRSVPVFVLAPILLIILILELGVMKRTPIGWDGFFSTKSILPVCLLAAGPLLVVVRQTRAGVIEVLSQNYVRTSRAKGLPERMVLTRHVLKNALTPVLTSMGLILSSLITGALFVELIFGIPGFAGLAISAFRSRDYPMILGTTFVSAFIIVVSNLLVDLSYGLLDPRVRYE